MSVYLVFLGGSRTRQSLRLNPGRYVMGRDATQCQVVLDAPDVGRMHAALEVDASGSAHLSDLGSRSGTFVNSRRIDRCQLAPNDVISLAKGVVSLAFR